MAMKRNFQIFLEIIGRLIYLAGTSIAICFCGGGLSFVQKRVGITYLILWNIWWAVTFLGRQRGSRTKYDPGSNWLVILSGMISVPFLILIPPLEYAGFSGPVPRDSVLSWIGLAIFALGIALQSAAMWQLRSFYTVRLGVQKDQKLVTAGMYSRIRHPGYFSYLLSIAGIALSLSSLATLIFIIPIFLFLTSRIAGEEKMLISEFGDSYREYMQKTRRLIPFLY